MEINVLRSVGLRESPKLRQASQDSICEHEHKSIAGVVA